MKKTIIFFLSALVTVSVASAATVSVSVMAVSQEYSAKSQKKSKANIKEVTFLAHIHCANCVKKLQENISFEKGVKGLHICMEDQTVSIKYDSLKTSEEMLRNAIEKLGVPVKGISAEGHRHDNK